MSEIIGVFKDNIIEGDDSEKVERAKKRTTENTISIKCPNCDKVLDVELQKLFK